jgi:integrase
METTNFFKRLLNKVLYFFPAEKQQVITFEQVLLDYIESHRRVNPPKKRTTDKQDSIITNIRRFLRECQPDLAVNEMRVKIMIELKEWLHNPEKLRSCSLSHSARHVEMCVAAMDYALNHELVKHNPIASFKAKRNAKKPIVHLEWDEFIKWAIHDFNNKTFQKVKELFLFSCNTGISHGDINTWTETFDAVKGITWLEGIRAKTGKPYYIPISEPGFELAWAIYKKHGGKLPNIHNAVYNECLKLMAQILDIAKWLTTHSARKTCATLLSQNGMAVPVIALILGHSEQTCRTDYVNSSKKNIELALER